MKFYANFEVIILKKIFRKLEQIFKKLQTILKYTWQKFEEIALAVKMKKQLMNTKLRIFSLVL